VARFVSILWFVGIAGVCLGFYEIFINLNSFSKPDTISIMDLEKGAPFNRHLTVTDARPLLDHSVVFHKTRRGSIVEGSEFVFVPMQEAAFKNFSSFTPFLLVKVPKNRFEIFSKAMADLNPTVQGIRMTQWELPDEAEKVLAKSFGNDPVKRMIILEFEKKPKGFFNSMEGLFVGLFICGFAYLLGRAGKGNIPTLNSFR
jgi:hypothetical protein